MPHYIISFKFWLPFITCGREYVSDRRQGNDSRLDLKTEPAIGKGKSPKSAARELKNIKKSPFGGFRGGYGNSRFEYLLNRGCPKSR